MISIQDKMCFFCQLKIILWVCLNMGKLHPKKWLNFNGEFMMIHRKHELANSIFRLLLPCFYIGHAKIHDFIRNKT